MISHSSATARSSRSKISFKTVNELITEVNDGTKSPEDKKQVAVQINSVLESLYQLSNSKTSGQFLFGGTRHGGAAVHRAL